MSASPASLVDQLDVVVVPADRPAHQVDAEGTSSVSITVGITASITYSDNDTVGTITMI